MPKFLHRLATTGFCFAIAVPMSLIPIAGHHIGREQVSFIDFWRRGVGPMFFLAGILFPVCSYGFVRARNWARYLYVATCIAIVLWSLIVIPTVGSLLGIAWLGLVVYYFFFRPQVLDYFGVLERSDI